MKTQVWVYVVVVVLSIGAGVAIAGVPTSVDRDPSIAAPPDSNGAATAPDRTSPAVTQPDVAASAPGTDDVETVATITEPVTPGSPPPSAVSPVTTQPPPPRAELDVAVVNGASVGGAATRVSDALEARGYVGVGSFDGTEIVDVTTIYAADGDEAATAELAVEVGITVEFVRPIAEAPEVDGLGAAPLVVYLGRDVVDLAIFQ